MILSPYLFSRFLKIIEKFYYGQTPLRNVYYCHLQNTSIWILGIFISTFVKIKGGILFNRIEIFIKKNVFNFLEHISYEDFLKISSEQAFNYLKSIEHSIKEIFHICVVDIFANSFTVLINTSILFFILPELGLLAILWMILHFCLLSFFFNKTMIENKNLFHSKNLLINNILENFLNILMIKTNNSQNYESRKLDTLNENYFLRNKQFLTITERINSIALLICELALWGCGTSIIIYKIQNSVIPVSTITYMIMVIYNIVGKIRNIGIKTCKLFEHLGEYKMIYNLLNTYPIHIKKEVSLMHKTNAAVPIIEFQNLNFFYQEKPILKNINLKIFAGEKVCFIGPSGSGKSTLVNLLCGLYENYDGQILINGHNIKEVQIEDIMNIFSIINQNAMLLTRSIKENLLQDRLVPLNKLDHYCKVAQIYDFIMHLPEKYNTIVNTKNLSGGQAQRLCLARMLLREKPIKIFDEATNGLDVKTKNQFLDLILNLIEEEGTTKDTMLFIDHSLEFLDRMDKVILLNEGEILLNHHYDEIKNHILFQKLKNHLN